MSICFTKCTCTVTYTFFLFVGMDRLDFGHYKVSFSNIFTSVITTLLICCYTFPRYNVYYIKSTSQCTCRSKLMNVPLTHTE